MIEDEKKLWRNFDRIHVIRRLRELIGDWWKIQLNFTDHQGFVRGVAKGKFFNPIHMTCQRITANQHGFKGCMSSVRKATIDGSQNTKAILSSCHAGFSTLTVPIRLDNQYLGCVFGDGFLLERTAKAQRAQIRSSLESLFPQEEHLVAYIDSLPILDRRDIDHLTRLLEIVVEEMVQVQYKLSSAEDRLSKLTSQLKDKYSFANIIGKSAPMLAIYQLIEKVAHSNALVLISGENGTGKELIAHALHYTSKRSQSPFLAINCGAFQPTLLESELFGHRKGAFTGASNDKQGLFEAVQNGTLFLDEIGDMPLEMQVKLLRVLQDGSFLPVGATKANSSVARIVCATNKDLGQMVTDGLFRQDLFYRLNVIRIQLPPLRERQEDIPLLIQHFVAQSAQRNQKKAPPLSPELSKYLVSYDWPGNIRELQNELEKLIILTPEGDTLDATFLSEHIRTPSSQHKPYQHRQAVEVIPDQGIEPILRGEIRLKDYVADIEKKVIAEGLQTTRWNKSELAKRLGISRSNLIQKISKYRLD
ncbi:MAG: sigma 54-interacting transcriptional regulator [Zetaproteobacteria bacterium]|nr:sigma 54-interacting transcriptional regulator [Zetaproteobacteria bacterium]